MVEIYQEQFIDLLCYVPPITGDHLIDNEQKILYPQKELRLKDTQNGGSFIHGAIHAEVNSVEEII